MIGLDTNMVIRLVTADDIGQAKRAREFVRARWSAGEPVFIGSVVLAEAVWVLDSVYGFARKEVAGVIEQLLMTQEMVLENHDQVRAALQTFRKGSVEFTDALIGEINRARGCEATATFDRKAAKLDGFVAVR